MKLTQPDQKLPAFDRNAVFAEVEKSNLRFEQYTKDQRRAFAAKVKALKVTFRVHGVRGA